MEIEYGQAPEGINDTIEQTKNKYVQAMEVINDVIEQAKESLEIKINTEDENDSVNHPLHYTSNSIECIDAIENSMNPEAFCGYLKGNVLKYLWRYKLKNNPIEDLKKAQWYLTVLIRFEIEQHEIDRYDP